MGWEESSARGSPRFPAGASLRVTGWSAQTAQAQEPGGWRRSAPVSLETRRKLPEAALRRAAAGWRSWGWSSRRKAAWTRKRTRLWPWSRRRRGRLSARRLCPGQRSRVASLAVNEKGGAGECPGRRRPLGCDCPRPTWFLSMPSGPPFTACRFVAEDPERDGFS